MKWLFLLHQHKRCSCQAIFKGSSLL